MVADHRNARLLSVSVLTECILVLGILAVVAGWRFTPPAARVRRARLSRRCQFISTRMPRCSRCCVAGKVGASDFVLQMMTGDAALLPAKEATLILSLPERGIEPMERRATLGRTAIGMCAASRLPQPGRWRMQIEALVTDFQKITLQEDLHVR